MRRIYIYRHHSYALFIFDFQRNWVENYNLFSPLLSVSHRCRSPSPPLSVIDSQQYPGSFYQPMVPIKHTALVILPAHIFHRISLLQNRAIPLLCWITPPVSLPFMGQDQMELQRRILFPQLQDNQGRPTICPICAATVEVCHSSIDQLCDLPCQCCLQCYTSAVSFIISPRELVWAMAGEGTAFAYNCYFSPLIQIFDMGVISP